jgi:hypothetical protein
MQVLMEDVEHHVQEEEGEMFDMVEDQIPEETLQRLGAQMEAEKARVKRTGVPKGGNEPAAARSAGT